MLDLFIHPGWKILQDEMREAYAILIETAYQVPDEQALFKRKGEIQKLGELLAFEKITRLQMEQLDGTFE